MTTAIPGRSALPELPEAVWRAFEPLTRILQTGVDEDEGSFWQDPAALLASVEAALVVVRTDPTPLRLRKVVDHYYTVADLERDLSDLERDLRWATEQGVPRVYLCEL